MENYVLIQSALESSLVCDIIIDYYPENEHLKKTKILAGISKVTKWLETLPALEDISKAKSLLK